MKTRLLPSQQKKNQVISLNRVRRYRSCQYFSCEFARSCLSAIMSNNCQKTVKESRYCNCFILLFSTY